MVAATSLGRSVPAFAQATGSAAPAQAPAPTTPAQPAPWKPVFSEVRRGIGYFTGRGGTIG